MTPPEQLFQAQGEITNLRTENDHLIQENERLRSEVRGLRNNLGTVDALHKTSLLRTLEQKKRILELEEQLLEWAGSPAVWELAPGEYLFAPEKKL